MCKRMKSGFLGRLPPISFCIYVVIKCNHIVISFYGLKSEAEIACKFQYDDFKDSIPYTVVISKKIRSVSRVSRIDLLPRSQSRRDQVMLLYN